MSTLNISLIQADLAWEDKEANLRKFETKIRALGKTELVILPEMFTTGFSMKPEQLAEPMDGPSIRWMKAISAAQKIILAGSLIIEEGGQYFNRLVWMLPNGQMGYYDKRHLFCLADEQDKFSPGNKRLIASVKGWRVNLLICYDLRFPVWSRQQTDFSASSPEPEYDLLVYVANWPDKRASAWKTLLPARAIENQCYVAAVNRVGEDGHGMPHSGHSMIIDPTGEILVSAAGEETILTQTLDKTMLTENRAKMPFWKDADSFGID